MNSGLELKNVSKSYGSFTLNNISLSIPGGTITGLIGANGAGKTTLIKCILNLLRPEQGKITFRGLDSIEDEQAFKEEIGVALDECPYHDIFTPPEVGRVMAGLYQAWDMPRFEQYLTQFGLPRDKKIKTFSRGMKMKLSIAAALSHHPRLLLLDEATSGLDPIVREEILDELLAFIEDEEHAVLLSSHITSDLEKVCDYIACLHQGELILRGEKDELLTGYGRLLCTRAELDRVDKSLLHGVRASQFSCEALVKDKRVFRQAYPELTVDPITLEELMLFLIKGEVL